MFSITDTVSLDIVCVPVTTKLPGIVTVSELSPICTAFDPKPPAKAVFKFATLTSSNVLPSIYALIDCCDAMPVALLEDISSSSKNALPSNMLSSAAVDVTPSNILSSAVVDVTPSRIFNSAVVDVTPSRMFISAAVADISVPLKLIASK